MTTLPLFSAAPKEIPLAEEAAELRSWLRLTLTQGVGSRSALRLLAAFGSAPAIFEQEYVALLQHVGAAQANALMAIPPGFEAALDTLTQWLQADARHAVWPLGHPDYPAELCQMVDPPLMLYVSGRPELARRRRVAIVGSRQATPQGIENARAFARDLSAASVTVVSGLAAGIDGAAHEGGLSGSGATIAVMGTGMDRLYPRRHQALAARIAQEGLLLTEYPLGTEPLPANFPKRNRIIAGLSLGTLVVEAALRSGSLITARLAIDMGREVFAIPGSIHSPQARGCNWLIQEGARLVQGAVDILDELRLPTLSQAAPSATARADTFPSQAEAGGSTDPVITAMGHDPVDFDTLQARTGMDTAALQARLLTLEIEGYVARLPGGRFQQQRRA